MKKNRLLAGLLSFAMMTSVLPTAMAAEATATVPSQVCTHLRN